MPGHKSLQDLFAAELKDLYSAEKQLIVAIPKMQKAANDTVLAGAFAAHLAETKNQVNRLETIGKQHGIKVAGKKCKGMEGVIAEGAEALEQEGDTAICDLAIGGAAIRVEHYEMAGYRTAVALAEALRYDDAVMLLTESLLEEQAADTTIQELCGRLMSRAESTQSKMTAS
jgi:ferritin-like metal-binding protein YciE